MISNTLSFLTKLAPVSFCGKDFTKYSNNYDEAIQALRQLTNATISHPNNPNLSCSYAMLLGYNRAALGEGFAVYAHPLHCDPLDFGIMLFQKADDPTRFRQFMKLPDMHVMVQHYAFNAESYGQFQLKLQRERNALAALMVPVHRGDLPVFQNNTENKLTAEVFELTLSLIEHAVNAVFYRGK